MSAARKATPTPIGEAEAKRHEALILNSWKKLAGSLSNLEERREAVQRMYERLAIIYEREPSPVHLISYPEALEDLLAELLPLAFHRAVQQAKWFPSAGETWGTVASDNAAQIEEIWQRIWHGALKAPRDLPGRHPEIREFCKNLEEAWPAPLVRAIRVTGGDDFYLGAKHTSDEGRQALLPVARSRTVSYGTVQELARFAASSGEREQTIESLFGNRVEMQKLALERAVVSAYIQKQLRQEKNIFGAVSSEARAKTLSRTGNKIETAKNAEESRWAAQALEV